MPVDKKSAIARWVTEGQFVGEGGSGATLTMGPGGFSPMELVLVGLAGCTGVDVAGILKKKRQAVTGFEVRVSGLRAETHPRVYTRVEIEYVVRGRGVDADAVAQAIELSERKYCSVSAMLAKTAEVCTSFKIIEEAGNAPA